MSPSIRYINGSGRSASAATMTNPTYNPIGFGVGYCGYGACDYECAEDYHREPNATGNVFQDAKGELGRCVYNYRFCESLRTGSISWTTGAVRYSYKSRHTNPSHRPYLDQMIT